MHRSYHIVGIGENACPYNVSHSYQTVTNFLIGPTSQVMNVAEMVTYPVCIFSGLQRGIIDGSLTLLDEAPVGDYKITMFLVGVCIYFIVLKSLKCFTK